MVIRSFFLTKNQSFSIPKKSKFLDIADTGNHPELIFMVDPEGIAELREFIVVNYLRPTVPEDAIYLGKFISNGKVNLVFEITNEPLIMGVKEVTNG